LESWGLYPAFEKRVLEYAKEVGVPHQPALLATELRQRFAMTPVASGYWLFGDGDGAVRAHVCSWLSYQLGTITIFAFQAQGLVGEDRHAWAGELRAWIDEINALRGRVPYIPAVAPLSSMEFVGPADPEVWARYLAPLGFTQPKALHLMHFEVEQPSAGKLAAPSDRRIVVPSLLAARRN